jgi:hypothetical protein
MVRLSMRAGRASGVPSGNTAPALDRATAKTRCAFDRGTRIRATARRECVAFRRYAQSTIDTSYSIRVSIRYQAEQVQRARITWREARIASVIDSVAQSMVWSGWPPTVVVAIVEQIGVWIQRLDDHVLANEHVLINIG